jgi:hypothetical protein
MEQVQLFLIKSIFVFIFIFIFIFRVKINDCFLLKRTVTYNLQQNIHNQLKRT